MISIITATYNSQKNIESCIQSVLDQDFKDIEYILVDGASSDNTIAIAQEMLEKSDLKSFKVISEPDKGIYDALNKGIQAATGDIIGFVHSDDLLASNDVLSSIDSTLSETNVDGAYGHLQYVAENDVSNVVRFWKSKTFKRKYLNYGWMPPHPTLFLKRKVYKEQGVFDLGFKIAADYEFILRVFSKSYNIQRIDKILVKMRLGGASNKNVGNIVIKMKEDLRALKQNKIILPINALVFKNLRKLNQFTQK